MDFLSVVKQANSWSIGSKVRNSRQRRQARREGTVPRKHGRWRTIIMNDPCSYCGGKGGTVDHIIPQSAGGANDWWNGAGSCPDCNVQKDSKPLNIFTLPMFS